MFISIKILCEVYVMKCLYRDYERIKDINNIVLKYNILCSSQSLNGESFKVIQQAVKQEPDYLKYCFDRIGVQYDEIYTNPIPCYKINGEILQLSDLSSGEKDYLYSLCCKRLNKRFILYGTLERLDNENREKYFSDFKDYDCIIISMNKSFIHMADSISIDELLELYN